MAVGEVVELELGGGAVGGVDGGPAVIPLQGDDVGNKFAPHHAPDGDGVDVLRRKGPGHIGGGGLAVGGVDGGEGAQALVGQQVEGALHHGHRAARAADPGGPGRQLPLGAGVHVLGIEPVAALLAVLPGGQGGVVVLLAHAVGLLGHGVVPPLEGIEDEFPPHAAQDARVGAALVGQVKEALRLAPCQGDAVEGVGAAALPVHGLLLKIERTAVGEAGDHLVGGLVELFGVGAVAAPQGEGHALHAVPGAEHPVPQDVVGLAGFGVDPGGAGIAVVGAVGLGAEHRPGGGGVVDPAAQAAAASRAVAGIGVGVEAFFIAGGEQFQRPGRRGGGIGGGAHGGVGGAGAAGGAAGRQGEGQGRGGQARQGAKGVFHGRILSRQAVSRQTRRRSPPPGQCPGSRAGFSENLPGR